jgi:CubicO group peptidase (beta-lactamase class C family)
VKVRTLLAIILLLAPTLFADDAQREAMVAKRAKGWVETLNAGDLDALERYAQQNFSPAQLARRTPDERRASASQILGMSGKLTIENVQGVNEEIVVNAKAANGDTLELRFRGQNEAPYLIDGIGMRADAGGGGPKPRNAAADLPPLTLPPHATKEQIASAVDAYIRPLEAKDVFSGNVLIARGDEVLFESAYGLAERSFNVKNRLSTRFNVGSITKDFTRIAIAQLAAAGKIDVDAPMIKYLPDYPNAEVAKKVTVQQLARHTSGLGDIVSKEFFHTNMRLFSTPQDFIDLHAKDPLQFEPGTSTKYSNYGYAVLAAIVEKVSGQDYFDYVSQHVFAPAGMAGSGFFDTSTPVPDVARGYSRNLGRDGILRDNIFALAARGAGFGDSKSTVRDLFNYHRAMAASKLLPPEWTRWFYTGERPSGAAPAQVTQPAGGVAGGAPGCNAVIASSGDVVVIVLTNLDPPTAEDLGMKVLLPALTK